MMRVFWDEWRGGAAFSGVKVLPALALGTAAAMLITDFQPGALFLVLVLGGLAGGLVSGSQRWNQLRGGDWVGLEGVSPLAYAAGKTTGVLLLMLAWAAFLTPPFVLIAVIWGLPLNLAVTGLIWALASTLGAQALCQLVNWSHSEFQRLLGAGLVFAWIAGTLQIPGAQALNPLWQIWRQFHDPETLLDLAALAWILGMSAGLWGVVILFLGREVKR